MVPLVKKRNKASELVDSDTRRVGSETVLLVSV
jgi:hypothetical protein